MEEFKSNKLDGIKSSSERLKDISNIMISLMDDYFYNPTCWSQTQYGAFSAIEKTVYKRELDVEDLKKLNIDIVEHKGNPENKYGCLEDSTIVKKYLDKITGSEKEMISKICDLNKASIERINDDISLLLPLKIEK